LYIAFDTRATNNKKVVQGGKQKINSRGDEEKKLRHRTHGRDTVVRTSANRDSSFWVVGGRAGPGGANATAAIGVKKFGQAQKKQVAKKPGRSGSM